MKKEKTKKLEALWIPRDVMVRLKRYKAFAAPDQSLSKVGGDMISSQIEGFENVLEALKSAA